MGAPVLLLAALREELAALERATIVVRRHDVEGTAVVEGLLDGRPVLLAAVGDGATRALRGASAVLDAMPLSLAVVVGVSGALSPGLDPGSVVAAISILDGETEAPAPDPTWTRRLVDSGVTPATIVASETILGTPAEKETAWARVGRGSMAAAVDLESAALARLLASRAVPFVVVRAVSDAADETLPLDFDRFRKADGGVDRGRVIIAALRRPSSIPALWRLRGRVAACSEILARAVRAVLAGDVA